MPDGELGAHLDALSAKFESWLAPKPPWTVAKVSAGRQEMLKKAIVGLVMTVEEIEGSFKLNQHKSDADHMAVANALAQQDDPASQADRRTDARVAAAGRLPDEAEQVLRGACHDPDRHSPKDRGRQRPSRPSSSTAPPARPASKSPNGLPGKTTSW